MSWPDYDPRLLWPGLDGASLCRDPRVWQPPESEQRAERAAEHQTDYDPWEYEVF